MELTEEDKLWLTEHLLTRDDLLKRNDLAFPRLMAFFRRPWSFDEESPDNV